MARYLSVARRINHKGAQIPPPSDQLIERMGRAFHSEWVDQAFLTWGHDIDGWDDSDPRWQESVTACMKRVYALIALSGGASIEDVERPDA
jgi:hypothetical protein